MSGEWVRGLNVGDYINVEFEGAWYRATIANKTETQVRIEYVKLINGKVKREFIRMTSERLAQDGSKNAGGGAAAVQQPAAAIPGAGAAAGAAGGAVGGAGGAAGAAGNIPPPSARQELVQGFGKTLSVNDKCDCLDDRNWRSATVLQTDESRGRNGAVFIHFEGWAAKWDAWFSRTSNKLQPRDSQTLGKYTGDPKSRPGGGGGVAGGNDYYYPPVDNTPKQWKQILSYELKESEIKLLDKQFASACKLKTQQQNFILAQLKNVDELEANIKTFKDELDKAKTVLPKRAKPYLENCYEIIKDVRVTLADTKKEQQRLQLIASEDNYFKQLTKEFYFVNIPSDGNCLFGATGRGNTFGAEISAAEHDGQVKAAVVKARKITVAESTNIADNMRTQAVFKMGEDGTFTAGIVEALRDAVQKVGLGGGNPTSKRLFAELKQAFDGQDLNSVVETKQARGIYCNVMMSPRFFGTKLEVKALSLVLKTPIYLYYRITSKSAEGSDSKVPKRTPPTEVIGREYESGGKKPIHLAFYLGKTHYNLMIPRHPTPDPEVVRREQERKRLEQERKRRVAEYKERARTTGFRRYKFVFSETQDPSLTYICLSQMRFYDGRGEWLPCPPVSNPGGNSRDDFSLANLTDYSDDTTWSDRRFKANGKSVLVFAFQNDTVVKEYSLTRNKTNDGYKGSPRRWEVFGAGPAADGDAWVKVDERDEPNVNRDIEIKCSIGFFVESAQVGDGKGKPSPAPEEAKGGRDDAGNAIPGGVSGQNPAQDAKAVAGVEDKTEEATPGGGAPNAAPNAATDVARNNNKGNSDAAVDAADDAKAGDGQEGAMGSGGDAAAVGGDNAAAAAAQGDGAQGDSMAGDAGEGKDNAEAAAKAKQNSVAMEIDEDNEQEPAAAAGAEPATVQPESNPGASMEVNDPE